MSNKKFIILAVIAVLMVVWAVIQSRISSGPQVTPESVVYLIQGLDPADIDSIVLGVGDSAVTLKRESGRFVVANKDNYPAEASKINDLLTRCLEIRTTQIYTDSPANHEDLQVTEKKARSVVKFLKTDSSLLTGIIVGKDRELGEGTYVRLATDDKVYVAPSVSWFGAKAMDYINQELISVKREDIQSVQCSTFNVQRSTSNVQAVESAAVKRDEYVLKAGEDGGKLVVLENMPEGKRLKSSDSETVFSAVTSLRFDDVMKNAGGFSFDKQFVCRLKDSTVYTIKISQKDSKTYITCQADFTDTEPVVMKENEVQSEEQLKKNEAKLLSRDKAKEWMAKHQGWIYEIADWKAKYLTKQLSDLLEDLPKPKEKAAEPNAINPVGKENRSSNGVKVSEPNAVKPPTKNSGANAVPVP